MLLRALLAPLLLVLSVILSFAAALGVGVFVSDAIFGFPGVDPTLPLLCFVFLVALGIDYNIFLMARVREEAIQHGTREGMLRGLAVTGAVITGAGIVLAGTFGALAVLPLVVLTEIGFIVAFGVLLDTFIVRSVIVPALVIDVGRRVWWPSRLSRAEDKPPASQVAERVALARLARLARRGRSAGPTSRCRRGRRRRRSDPTGSPARRRPRRRARRGRCAPRPRRRRPPAGPRTEPGSASVTPWPNAIEQAEPGGVSWMKRMSSETRWSWSTSTANAAV